MYAIPNSAAMDTAAGGSGPGAAVLPWIVSAEPEQILRYGTDLLSRMARLVAIVGQIDVAGQQLRQSWPSGSASDGATAKVRAGLAGFTRITTAVQALQGEIQASAQAVQLVQHAYRTVISAVNPTVAALLSNPYTHAAATALATSTTSGLAGYVGATRAVLDTIGLVRLTAIITTLATIADDLKALLSPTASA
jgi:hypothetical protein